MAFSWKSVGITAALVVSTVSISWFWLDRSARIAREASLESSLGELRSDLAESRQDRAAVAEALSASRAQASELTVALDAAQRKFRQTEDDLAQLAAQRDSATEQARKVVAEADALRESLAILKLEVSRAGADDLALLETRIEELTAELSAIKAPKTGPADAAIPVIPTSLPVLAVAPGNAFVVLGGGANAGVRTDWVYALTREDETLAVVQITSVEADHAIGQVRPESLRGDLHPEAVTAIAMGP